MESVNLSPYFNVNINQSNLQTNQSDSCISQLSTVDLVTALHSMRLALEGEGGGGVILDIRCVA